MASGSARPDSISLSSDQLFDRNCSVCEPKGKVKEAVKYCTACLEYFCQECLDFHNSLPVLRDHQTKLLGKSTMLRSTVKRGSRDTITTMCEDHSGKLLEMFCEDDNVVCCTICVAENHRICENVKYIPKIVGGFSKSKDTPKLKSDLQKIKKELTRIKSSRQKDQTRIQHERDRALTQIKDARRRINVKFDELEMSVIDETWQRHRNYSGKIQTDLDECDNVVRQIEATIKRFDHVDQKNEAQLFVDVKKGAENLCEFRELVEQIQDRLGTEQVEFTVDDGIHEFVSRLERLGTFVDEMRGAAGKADTVDRSEADTVDRSEDVMVKAKKDKRTCYIHGSCCLPDGGILLSDFRNSKLKRLDSSYQITDSCSIVDPFGVCYIPNTKEAAVCQGGGPVHIVSVGRTMTVTRSIKTDHKCYGVSYNNGQLYVGQHGYKVHVYDFVSGDYLSTVHTDGQGQPIFSDIIRHIATNPDGASFWVADCKKGLIQLDKSGNILRTITDLDLAGATGVCLGRDDNVLVCGTDSQNVLQLSLPSEKVSTLVRSGDLPAKPLSICYDQDRARLLVTMYWCDHVKVFYIKY